MTRMLNSHMLMKWNSCENSWMVSAAFTRHRRSSVMAAERVFSTSARMGLLWLYCWAAAKQRDVIGIGFVERNVSKAGLDNTDFEKLFFN